MSEALVIAVAGLSALIVLCVILLVARDRVAKIVWRIKNPPEKLAAQRAAFEHRLRTPDWQFYAEHLQRPVPISLPAAYAKPGLITKAHVFGDYYVTFAPIDRKTLTEAWVLPGVVAFAESDGDPIFLKVGASASDSVFIAYHDGGGTEELAPSVEAFLSELRDAA